MSKPFRWWDAYRKQFGLKDFLSESQAVAQQQIKERRLPMIEWISVRQSTVSNIRASLPGAGYGQFAGTMYRLQNSKKRAERSERLTV